MRPAHPARDDRLSRILAASALALFIAVLALASPTPAVAGAVHAPAAQVR